MRVLLVTMLTTAHALTPNRNIKIARKGTLDSSVTFDESDSSVVRISYALDEPKTQVSKHNGSKSSKIQSK